MGPKVAPNLDCVSEWAPKLLPSLKVNLKSVQQLFPNELANGKLFGKQLLDPLLIELQAWKQLWDPL